LCLCSPSSEIGSSPLKGYGGNSRPGRKYWQPTAGFMTHVTCRLTAKNRDLLQNPTLSNRVWASFFTIQNVMIYSFVVKAGMSHCSFGDSSIANCPGQLIVCSEYCQWLSIGRCHTCDFVARVCALSCDKVADAATVEWHFVALTNTASAPLFPFHDPPSQTQIRNDQIVPYPAFPELFD